jgi:glycosyltransferase involved in cell wall biosynthesis
MSPSAGQAVARVTVIVPCYNDGELLLETIDSIDEPETVELIVVDDCSNDQATIEILERIAGNGTTVLRHDTNQGPAESRNTALHAAETPYVFPLDADDLAVSGVLTRMADRLDADPGAAVCFGDYLEFGPHELVRAVPPDLDAFRLAYVNEYPVSSLFRRSDLLVVGGWRELGPGYEDWNLWLTLVELGYRGVHVGPGTVTYRRRLHGDRMLTTAKRNHRAYYRLIRSIHPRIYGDLARHRRESNLPRHRKLLYPIVYGARPRFGFERPIKRWLDRYGVWTLRR